MNRITYRRLENLRSKLLSNYCTRSEIFEDGNFIGLLLDVDVLCAGDIRLISRYLAGVTWFVELHPYKDALYVNFEKIYLEV